MVMLNDGYDVLRVQFSRALYELQRFPNRLVNKIPSKVDHAFVAYDVVCRIINLSSYQVSNY